MRYLIGLLIVLTSCTNESLDEKSFNWAKEVNEDDERFFEIVEVKHKINLTDLELDGAYDLKVSDDNVVFKTAGDKEIAIFDKNNLEDYYTLEFPEGRGPGEVLGINDYEVFEDQIFLADNNQSKILIFDLDGVLIKEFIVPKIYLENISVLNENTILNYSMGVKEQMFNIFKTDGKMVTSFIEHEPDFKFMMYTGEIHAEDNNIYFSGYSEPIIKKYSIEEEELKFSVKVIDSYNSQDNYLDFANGQGFTEDALYNTIGMDAFGDILVNVPRHNDRSGYKYIDFYSNEDGEYLKSIEMIGYPDTDGIQIDSEYIYSLEMDTSRISWLVMYENNF